MKHRRSLRQFDRRVRFQNCGRSKAETRKINVVLQNDLHCMACSAKPWFDHSDRILVQVVVSGPWPVPQYRTCVSGQRCSFLLMGIQPADLVLVLDTCGLPSVIPKWPAGGLSLPVGENATVDANESISLSQRLTWGDAAVTAAGATYRLCWCPAGSVCDTFANFAIDIGTVDVLGPRPGATTCVSGRACSSHVQGHMISSNDTIWALETCGVQGRKFEFSIRGVLTMRTGTSTVQIANSFLVGLGGTYKLCWCGPGCPCADGRDFNTEADDLVLQGPSDDRQDRTCISGRTCVVEGVQGQDLSDMDEFLIQDSCGSDQVAEYLVKMGSHVEVTASGAVVHWGTSPHTAPGGVYKLCWCTNRPSHGNLSTVDLCATPSSFVSSVGNLALRGPAPLSQDRTCISGKTCKVTGIQGHLFSFGQDAVMVLDTCAKLGSSAYAIQASLESGGVLKFEPQIQLYGGTYRLCWCGKMPDVPVTGLNQSWMTNMSNLTSCQRPEEFQTDFGTLHIAGPRPAETDLTCVSGRACYVWHQHGHFVNEQTPGNALILDTCGAPMISLTRHYAPANVTEPHAAFALMDVPVHGGHFRLCWCEGDCSSAQAYTLDVGRIWLVGPSSTDQHRTCISGRMCQIRDILGVGLSSADRAMVMDTCGAASHISGVSSAGMSNMFANSTSFVWSITSANGGQYRLCWCTQGDSVALSRTPVSPSFVAVPNCSDSLAFGQQFGQLHLIGPTHPDQAFTCVSGQTCYLRSIHDAHTSLEDMIVLLDTCGSATSYVPRSATQPASPTEIHGQLLFSWNGVQTMQGGQYRLCWCTTRLEEGVNASAQSLCGQPDQFVVDYGQLHVVGPALGQIRTCVAGWPCHLKGISGNDLQAGDAYLILDTCGAPSLLPESPSGFLASSSNRGTYVAFDWVVSSSGGSYRICWCGSGFPCSSFEEFRVDLGELVLQGPRSPDQSFTCTRGQRCRVSHIQGVLSESAEFMILETCAVNIAEGTLTSALPINGSLGSAVVWEIQLTMPGGEYRLCWCAEALSQERAADNRTLASSQWAVLATNSSSPFNVTFSSTSACLQPTHQVDVGSLHLVGPIADQAFTCVSGRRCVLDSVLGLGLSVNDSYLILDTCGTASVARRFTQAGRAVQVFTGGTSISWGDVAITVAGGEYRLCWCPSGFGNASDLCAAATGYTADAGSLRVIGVSPLAQDRTCVSGWPCRIEGIVGTALTSLDALAVLETCGEAEAPAAFEDSEAKPAMAIAPDRGLWQWTDSTSVISGGMYRLCWCSGMADNSSMATNASCMLHTDFRVDIGVLTVLGPAPLRQTLTCISGHSCRVDGVTGVDVSRNAIMILDTCGGQGNAQLRPSRNLDAVSSARLTLQGGQYNLCWCPEIFSSGTNNSNYTGAMVGNQTAKLCQAANAFTVAFGTLQVIGPYPLWQDRTCISGQTCQLDSIQGLHLSESDSWFVLETCGSTNLVTGFPSTAGVHRFKAQNVTKPAGVVVTWHMQLTSAGGTYRLCWCSWPGDANLTRCLSEQVDTGKLEVLGPNGQAHWAPTQRGHCGMRPSQPAPEASSTYFNLTMDACRAACDYQRACIAALFADRGAEVGLCSIMVTCATIADSSKDTLLLFPESSRPDIKQSRTCVSGQTCMIKGLLGQGLMDTDAYLLMETCGVADGLVDRVDSSGLSVSLQAANATLSFGSPLSAAGGMYRLCWCSGLATCSTAESFRTDVGGLVLVGPAPLRQERTCIAGRRCLVDGVLGQHLADGDRLWIMDTCGTAAKGNSGFLFADSADSWLASPSQASGASFSWEVLASSFPGGQYRLCWCSATQACSGGHDYIVDVGGITLQGPLYSAALLQERTCVAGLSCVIDGLQGQLQGLAMILDTCGSTLAFPPNVPKATSNYSGQVRWDVLTVPGGMYQLCWCTANMVDMNESNRSLSHCRSSLDYRVTFGVLTVVGPAAGQTFTCVGGQACEFAGISGQGLLPEDSFLVLETCGTASPVGFGDGRTVPSMTAEGNRSLLADWSWAFHDGNMSFRNGSASCSTLHGAKGCRTTEPVLGVTWSQAVTAPAGTYQLCWCSLAGSCSTAERFLVPSGQILLRGPTQHQDRTCVAGQTCALNGIHGQYLDTGDVFMILETCGSAFLPPGIPPFGFIENGTDPDSRQDNSTADAFRTYRVSWGMVPFTSSGGLHRLCWCASGGACTEAGGQRFQVDFGGLFVVGPTPNFNEYDRWVRGSCTISQHFSQHAGATKAECYTLGRYAPPRVIAAEFYSLGNVSSCVLLHACEGFVSSAASHFELLFLHSVATQDRTCISGLSCSIDAVMGLGLSSGDSFMVLDTCGSLALVEGMPESSSVVAIGSTFAAVNGTNDTDLSSDVLSLLLTCDTCSVGLGVTSGALHLRVLSAEDIRASEQSLRVTWIASVTAAGGRQGCFGQTELNS